MKPTKRIKVRFPLALVEDASRSTSRGQLDESWSDWLGGLEVKLLDNGEMILFGYIGDQAALMGILNKLYGLNLTLLSVSEVGKKK